MGVRIGGGVERVDARDLRYERFVESFLEPNLPVLLTGLMDAAAAAPWRACADWVSSDPRRPNLPFFSARFPNSTVQVADCSMREFTDQKKLEMSLADYISYWIEHSQENRGTWTPLHADVFRSYSWSANVCGRKRWLFLPPSQCHLIFDRNLKSSVYDVYGDVSETQFPGFKKTVWLECIQEQNEIIFVPSGWYHQVHNLEDTISINHNWFNAYNLSWVWNLLVEDYNVAKEYIEDIRDICDDFESLCQRNLAANTGMNFYDFFIFITRFALANITQIFLLQNVEDAASNSSIKADHFIYNVKSIHAVASRMKSVDGFAPKNLSSCSVENRSAFSDVKKILEEESFHQLCAALLKTYVYIHGQGNNTVMRNSNGKGFFRVANDITDCISEIRGPEDLVRLIEYALQKSNAFSDAFNSSLRV